MCVPLVVTGILFELFLAGGARDAHWTGTNEDASVASVKSIRDAGLMYLLANCSISMFCSTCLVLTSPSLSFGDRDFRTFSFGDWWSFPLTHLDFLGFSLRLACGTAVSLVRISISVCGSVCVSHLCLDCRHHLKSQLCDSPFRKTAVAMHWLRVASSLHKADKVSQSIPAVPLAFH